MPKHLDKISELRRVSPCGNGLEQNGRNSNGLCEYYTHGVDEEEEIEEAIEKARDHNNRIVVRDVQQEFEELMKIVDNSLPSQILDMLPFLPN